MIEVFDILEDNVALEFDNTEEEFISILLLFDCGSIDEDCEDDVELADDDIKEKFDDE